LKDVSTFRKKSVHFERYWYIMKDTIALIERY